MQRTVLNNSGNKWKNLQSQRGMSLLTVLVFVGCAATIIFYLASKLVDMSHTQLRAKIAVDSVAMQRSLASGVDCSTTIANLGSTCTPGAAIAIKAKSNHNPNMVAIDGSTTMGNGAYSYQLKASCEDCTAPEACPHNHKLKVQYKRSSGTWKDLYAPSRMSKYATIDLSACEVPF